MLDKDAQIVKHHFGVKEDGNVEAQHDAHGELTGMVCHSRTS